MADTVNLMVVGVAGGLSKEEITKNLVDEFGQDASSFKDLIAAAFGDTDAYAAQSGVNFVTAEAGSEQLQKLGLECKIVTSDDDESNTDQPLDNAEEPQSSEADIAVSDAEAIEDSTGKSADQASTDQTSADQTSADKAPADKGMALDVGNDLDFSDELGAIDVSLPAAATDTTEQSDAIEEASDSDLDFSDELGSIGTQEIDSDKTNEPSQLDSKPAPKEEATVETEKAPDSVADSTVRQKKDGEAAIASVVAADTEELAAELIDPAPLAKPKKDNVVLDDGGLSLSDDDAAPLTKPKAKSNPDAADDGGLSLSDSSDLTASADSVVQAEKPASQDESAEPAATTADESKGSESDIGTNETSEDSSSSEDLFADDFEDLESSAEEASANEKRDTETEVKSDETEITEIEDLAAEKQAAQDQDSDGKSVSDDPGASSDASADQLSEEDDAQSVDATDASESEESESDSDDNEKPVLSTLASIAELAAKSSAKTPVSVNSGASDGGAEAPDESSSANDSEPAASGGLVLSAQPAPSVVPQVTPAEELDQPSPVAEQSADAALPDSAQMSDSITEPVAAASDDYDSANDDEIEPSTGTSSKGKKLVAAVATVAVLGGGGLFALKNFSANGQAMKDHEYAEQSIASVQDAQVEIKPVQVVTGDLSDSQALEELSTEELLANLSVRSNTRTIADLGHYFSDSVNQARSGPRFGAAVPAKSGSMIHTKNRVEHPADQYFDAWSNREADLSLFLALLDNLIEKGELDLALQLSDRAKDKLFSVMSTLRMARAFSDSGKNEEVSGLMDLASRDTFAIKASEERVLAMSEYALSEQAIGLNEDAMDSFLKSSILARSLGKPELKTVGLSSAARYFHSSGRNKDAQKLLTEATDASMELPENTAARSLASRYIALAESRMGLFSQALERTRKITDPLAAVSAYHGIALAIESSGDENGARRVLNMAYREASKIDNEEERSYLLSKVVLASESQ